MEGWNGVDDPDIISLGSLLSGYMSGHLCLGMADTPVLLELLSEPTSEVEALDDAL